MTDKITNSYEMKMTDRQLRTIERLIRDILLHDGLGAKFWREHEFKQLDVTQFKGGRYVYLTTEVGSKTDEGTMASILCRTRRNICIGPRGGVELLNARDMRCKNRHATLKRNPRGYWNAIHCLTG